MTANARPELSGKARLTAAKYRLANLTAMVDYNDVQLDGPVHEVMPLEPLAGKWHACGWHVLEVNGHDVRQVAEASGNWPREIHDRPTVIICHTTKGKGVSFMENQSYWHGNVPECRATRARRWLNWGRWRHG